MDRETGSALIFALIVTAVMMVLGLGLSITALGDFTMSEEFEARERALLTAEEGLAAAQRTLRGRDLSSALAETRQVQLYTGVAPGFYRDPISLVEARSVDFARLPNPVSTVSLSGLLTPPSGFATARGRYFARLSDNDDGDGDLLADTDGRVFIRVTGIEPGPAQEFVSLNSNRKNAVVMVEATLKRVMTFDVQSPFSVYGPSVNPAQNRFFDGNSFKIDGYDHSNMTVEQLLRGGHPHNGQMTAQPAISVLNDDPSMNDGRITANTIYNGMSSNQYDNVEGAAGDFGAEPSIRDDTERVRNSGNEDATNIFSAYFLQVFLQRVTAAADVVYPDGTNLSGSGIELGTESNPEVVVCEGDLTLAGNGSGAGLLIVKGTLNYQGAFNYNGLILVIGEGELEIGGANKSIIGGIYLARLERDAQGNPSFGAPSFTLAGNSNFYFRGDSVRMAYNLLPMRQIGWREITAEIAQ